ncbi:MAG: hypothetical protein SFV51_09250 [Bryobacteraceae bacterium]|nr:hypothetical protein [Bryobacteraceae bacterium]
MRRAQAILLLFLLSFPLITPLLSSEPESKLPACCRRDGKHGCSMDKRAPSGVAMANARMQCPQYPTARAMPAAGAMDAPPALTALELAPAGPAAVGQSEAQYRVSFSRARQKRGPPSPLP